MFYVGVEGACQECVGGVCIVRARVRRMWVGLALCVCEAYIVESGAYR